MSNPELLSDFRDRKAVVTIHCGKCGAKAIWLRPGESLAVHQPDVRCAACEAKP